MWTCLFSTPHRATDAARTIVGMQPEIGWRSCAKAHGRVGGHPCRLHKMIRREERSDAASYLGLLRVGGWFHANDRGGDRSETLRRLLPRSSARDRRLNVKRTRSGLVNAHARV